MSKNVSGSLDEGLAEVAPVQWEVFLAHAESWGNSWLERILPAGMPRGMPSRGPRHYGVGRNHRVSPKPQRNPGRKGGQEGLALSEAQRWSEFDIWYRGSRPSGAGSGGSLRRKGKAYGNGSHYSGTTCENKRNCINCKNSTKLQFARLTVHSSEAYGVQFWRLTSTRGWTRPHPPE